jgi:hypothetical protein
MAELQCSDCGVKGYPTAYTSTCAEKNAMDAHGVCFTCAFWRVQVEKKHETVIDGRIYGVGDRPKGGRHNGMAGRRFDIEYFDGRKVTTYDLWAGGDVPERYADQIPNTARFLGGAGAVKVGETVYWNPSREEA